MNSKIKPIIFLFLACTFVSWYDPILDLFTRATTATLDLSNDWILFHDVTDGKKKKSNLSTSLDISYFRQGGNLGSNIFGSTTGSLHIITDNTHRLTIPESGITSSTTASKVLTLDSNDSLMFNTVISAAWSNSTAITTGTDTLLNSSVAYGHYTRVGNIVTFSLRIELGLGSSGDPETISIDPPIASNFITSDGEVIGTATMDTQGTSSANTAKQRCVLLADTVNDKIIVEYDPVASLTYPENRMYVNVSGSYIIQ